MADAVRLCMEAMVPELEKLVKEGSLTSLQMKEVLKHRQLYEFKIHRRIPKQEDYLRYLEYELNLSLTVPSYHSLLHINRLFQRMLKKWAKNFNLWLTYLAFLNQTNAKKMGLVYSRMIRLFPLNESVWISYSDYEYLKGNMTGCRTLFQRALRLMPENKALWTEYFRFEVLVYMNEQIPGLVYKHALEHHDEEIISSLFESVIEAHRPEMSRPWEKHE